MKTSKRFLALVLSALMIFSVVIIPGADLSLFGFEADAADITLGGITQQRVVSNYASTYAGYQSRFFGGSDTNWPTNFVIPGLGNNDDYTPQGMTYWKAKEWILISAYDAGGSDPTVIYALDAVTTDFVALFKIYDDAAHTVANNSHGGGIAASEYNFYFADDGSSISYIPLSEMDVAKGTVKNIHPWGSIDFSGELTPPDGNPAAKTSYCCYDDGILWAGNFHWYDDSRYTNYAYNNNDLKSMLMGYKLAGNSSAEEWYYLSENYNLVKLNSTIEQADGNTTYKSVNYDGANASIYGTITTTEAIGEVTKNFATVNLTEGVTYKIEFISNNYSSDMYLFAPNGGGHCNVKGSNKANVTKLSDDSYHYEMIFTAGLRPATAEDSGWPTTQSTDGTYTGTYTIRFDQDHIPVGGREFNITDFSISKYAEANGFTPDKHYEGIGCAGNPTYVVGLTNIDRVQYAMVDKGKIYISRSWSRSESTNHVRELIIGDMDIYSPGNTTLTINGRERRCHTLTGTLTRFGGGKNDAGRTQMLYMGEALCVIEDYLYMFGESAAYTYRDKESSKCPEPIDVIWKIDQHKLNGVARPAEEVKSMYYEKINTVDEIINADAGTEFIFVFESQEKDPVTQKPVLYALDSFGGYDGAKLPKKIGVEQNTAEDTRHSIGIIGYPITEYSTGTSGSKEIIYLNETDDNKKSIRWAIEHNGTGGFNLLNSDYYYGNNRNLCFAHEVFSMNEGKEDCGIVGSNGNFNITNWGHTLWCNPGYTQEQLDKYTYLYKNHGQTGYVPVYNGLEEVKGTFHIEPKNPSADQNVSDDYQIMHIYKRVQDPYASTLDTDVYTDLNAELQADGTYTVNLETYATAAVQYVTLTEERPIDFIFAVDTSKAMRDNTDVVGYQTDRGDGNNNGAWSALTMKQAAGDNDDIAENGNYNREWTSNFYYRLPDGEFARISVAVNAGPDSSWNGNFSRDIWLWCKHPVTGRCYKISQNGYLLVNNCTGNPSTDSSSKLTETMYLSNPSGYGYASASEILSEASSDKNRTDYHNRRGSKDERRAYGVLNYTYTDGYGNTQATYYSKGSCNRLGQTQQLLEELVFQIKANSPEHRISLVTYGQPALSYQISSNGKITTANSLASINYNEIFFDSSKFDALRSTIASLKTDNTDGQPVVGTSRAANTVLQCGTDYSPTGDRAAVIILLTGANGLTETTTNAAIEAAKAAKEFGAFLYTVKIGNSSNSYTENFFNYTSSNYISSQSIANPGERNRHTETEFYASLPTNTYDLNTLSANFLPTVLANSKKSALRINEKTIIREKINSIFNMENAKFSYSSIKADYDGLGRLYFHDDSPTPLNNLTTTESRATNTLTVKGYNFTDNYVSTSNPTKRAKLVVSISGLTLNPGTISNERVTVDTPTALYINENYLSKGIIRKGYPTDYINVPEYTYVLDYGISMLDTDVNGTLLSIDDAPVKQSTYKNGLAIDDKNNNVIVAMTEDKKDLLYSLKPDASGANNSAYCLIDRENGTYDWFKINVVPASNVYFEEELATPTPSDYSDWTLTKDEDFDFSQNLTSTNDVYGYDSNYKNEGAGFSHGSIYTSEVNDKTLRSDTLTFDYTGSAIDLYGSCGEDTGIYIITVRREDNSVEKVYITDTYLSDSTLYGNNHRINQVPFVHHENADHGKYTVEVTSAFLASMIGQRNPVRTFGLRNTDEGVDFYSADFEDEVIEAILSFAEMEDLMGEDIEISFCDENSVLNGGEGADVATTFGFFSTNVDTDREFDVLTNYFDGFRVYQPTFGNHDGNYPEYEQGAQFYNVVDTLLTEAQIKSIGGTEGVEGIGYIEKVADTDYNFGTYDGNGPKNELYLKPGKSIAINVHSTSNAAKAMISLRAINGVANAKITAYNGTDTVSKAYSVDHIAEMYYRIDGVTFAEGATSTITVENTGSKILVIDTVKLANGLTMAPMMMSAMPRMRMMMAAPATEAEVNEPIEDKIPDIPAPEAPPVVEMPEGPSTTPDGDTGEDKGFIEQITENFTKLLNMIQSMLDKIVNLLKSIMA